MKRIFFALGISLFLITSCTITQKFEFKEDWSGTYSMDIDMSEMAGMMGGMGEEDSSNTDGGGMDMGMEETLSDIESIEGISDVVYEEDEKKGTYRLSYKFKDLDALNRSLVQNGLTKEVANSEHTYFSLSGTKLTYTMPGINDNDESPTAELAGMDDMMMDMMKYRLHFQFDKGVKKAKSKQAKKGLSTDDNSVRWEPALKDLMELEGETVITISINK